MLETIREYALEQLHSMKEAHEFTQRHAEYYADLVEQAEPQFTGPEQTEWHERLAAERPNLRAALNCAKTDRSIALGLSTAGRLWRFWQLRGGLTEGRHWLEQLLEAAGDEPSIPIGKALIGHGWVCYWLADLDNAESSFQQAVELLETLGNVFLHAEALFGQIITLACHRGRVEQARPLHEKLQELLATHQHPALMIMNMSATVKRFPGDHEGAHHIARQVLSITQGAGNPWWEGEALRALGQIT